MWKDKLICEQHKRGNLSLVLACSNFWVLMEYFYDPMDQKREHEQLTGEKKEV